MKTNTYGRKISDLKKAIGFLRIRSRDTAET